MIADQGFYPITCELPDDKTPEDAAKAHGERNVHVNRIESIEGKTLWERTKQ